MVGDSSYDPEEDEHDNLAALDFFLPDEHSDEPDPDVLSDYVVGQPVTADAESAVEYPIDSSADVDEAASALFTVTNPPGTVTVTTFMDGRVQQIDLSPRVTNMTETDLAEEITVIAGLATQDAKAAQYAYMLDSMRQQGHDDVATRDFLTRDLDLPTPEAAEAARAHVFSTRYAVEND